MAGAVLLKLACWRITWASSLSRGWLFCDPMDCSSHRAPPSTGFPRQEYWNALPFPPQGIFPTQELNSGFLKCRFWFRNRVLDSVPHGHGRGLGPRDALKKDSRCLSRVAAGKPRFPRLLPAPNTVSIFLYNSLNSLTKRRNKISVFFRWCVGKIEFK